MAPARRPGGPAPVSDVAARILDPLMRRRVGISMGLVQSWDEIVGERLASSTRPEKIAWPRRLSEADPFQPATLVIACSGMAALAVQHESGEIIERVNAFLGFAAVGRLRIVQKEVASVRRPAPPPRPLAEAERRRIDEVTAPIEDDGLRAALARLGESVLRSRR